jgi:hypothetical protein
VIEPAPPPPELSPAAAAVKEQLSKYKTFLSTETYTTAGSQHAAKTFANVAARMLQTPTDEVFGIVWDFFVDNQDGVLMEIRALQGVEVLDHQTRFRLELIYTIFRKAAAGVDIGNSQLVRTDILQQQLRCPQLVLFLQNKASVVARRSASA